MRVWIRLRWQLVLKFLHNLLIDGPLDTSWFMRCEFESMVGGRPLGVLLCFSIHGAGITGSISNFFYRLTSLEPSGNKNHRRPDVPSSWTNWFVHVCSFHHLWSILMIFDDFWSLGSGLVHFGPCPEGHLTPRWLEGVTRGGDLGDACAGYDLAQQDKGKLHKANKGKSEWKRLSSVAYSVCNYHINRKQFSSTTWVILERAMARRAWQPWFQGATEASVSALESLASCWPTWWLPWGVAARNHIPAVLWCQ